MLTWLLFYTSIFRTWRQRAARRSLTRMTRKGSLPAYAEEERDRITEIALRAAG
jgi:hypothetical protein